MNWPPAAENALNEALDVLRDVWAETLVAGYSGEIRLSFHVQDGDLNHIRETHPQNLQDGADVPGAAIQAFQETRRVLVKCLPAVFVRGYYGVATLAIEVQQGRATGVHFQTERIHRHTARSRAASR